MKSIENAKRIVLKKKTLILGLILVFVLSACGRAAPTPEPSPQVSEEAAPKKAVIGYSPPTLEMTDFYAFGERGLLERADELGLDLEVITKAPPTHAAADEQLRIIEDFITQQVDFIWLVPVSVEAAGPMIKAANEAGIPIITGHNIEPYPEGYDVFAYVGTDFGKTGTAVGEWIAEHLDGRGKVGIVQGAPGSFNEWRVDTAIAVLEQHPDIEVIASDFTDWDTQTALNVASTMLEAHPDIDLIYCPAAPLTLGVVEAVENAGLTGQVEVVDYDLIPATQKLAKEGKVVAGLAMFPYKYGEEVANIVNDVLAGKEVALVHEVPGEIVEADEIDRVFPEWYRQGSEPDETEESSEAAPAEPRKIAYVAWNMNNPWSVILRDAIKSAVEAGGDTFLESDPSGDPAKQVPQIETFIGQGVDGIILTPTDAQAVLPPIQAADEAGIPVVIVGAGANEGAWKAAVLTDNFEGGRQIGQYIVDLLGGEGKVVATDVPGIQDAEERRAGWESAFEGTNIEILDYQTGGTVESGIQHMENWLQQFGEEIDAVMGVNDPTGLGALTVIEEAGLQEQIVVVGVDGSDAAIEAMEACRSFGATAQQLPAEMGKMATETLYKILSGESVEREVRVPTTLLVRDDYCSE